MLSSDSADKSNSNLQSDPEDDEANNELEEILNLYWKEDLKEDHNPSVYLTHINDTHTPKVT